MFVLIVASLILHGQTAQSPPSMPPHARQGITSRAESAMSAVMILPPALLAKLSIVL